MIPAPSDTRREPPHAGLEATNVPTATSSAPETAASSPETELRSDRSANHRTVSADGRWAVFIRPGPPSELWLASTDDGRERRVLVEQEDDKPERNLVGFDALQFSPDGRALFFLTEAWATSAAVHSLDLRTLKQRFVVDAVDMLVIASGKYAGHLFVQRHRYKDFPGEGFHSYEWCGVVTTDGRIVRTFSTDERLCPSHADEDRAEIEAALGLPPGGLDAP